MSIHFAIQKIITDKNHLNHKEDVIQVSIDDERYFIIGSPPVFRSVITGDLVCSGNSLNMRPVLLSVTVPFLLSV
jgi:hypothetical protein